METVYVLFSAMHDLKYPLEVKGIFTTQESAEAEALKLVKRGKWKEVVDPRDVHLPAHVDGTLCELKPGVVRAWESSWAGIWIEERKLNAVEAME